MEWLTFFAICIAVVPMQIMLFLCLFWFRQKFDKYENIAVGIINKYIEVRASNSASYSDEDIKTMLTHYNSVQLELDPDGNEFMPLLPTTPANVVVKEYRRIHSAAMRARKRFLIENSIKAIAHTMKDRYRGVGLGPWVANLNGKFGNGVLGNSIDRISSAEWLDDNPFVSAALDLVSGAWVYVSNEGGDGGI